MDTYKYLENHKTQTQSLVNWHFKLILTSVRRKITLRQKYRDPFTITVTSLVHPDIFYQAFRAVRDFKTKIGFKADCERTAKGKPKLYVLTFDQLGVFKFHLCKLSNSKSVSHFLKKEFVRGEKGTIEVSSEKPAVISYKVSTGTLTLQCSYICKNSFGYICSF